MVETSANQAASVEQDAINVSVPWSISELGTREIKFVLNCREDRDSTKGIYLRIKDQMG